MQKANFLCSIVEVDSSLCVNCHMCISVCPVKFCNDGSDSFVTINPSTCIGCGACIDACTHLARKYIDDFQFFINDIIAGEKIISVVSPSIAASFPDKYLQLNSFLKQLGVEANFDVSFGAELTIKSYIEYINEFKPKTVIAQPCPAIVNYIEIYKPELLKYLAPVDSPIIHTIKMIKNYYPQYKNHKVAIISPCIAKKREFSETGLGDYNVAIISVNKFLTENNIDLTTLPETDYDNPPAERAVQFSSPGGLLKTLQRWIPDIDFETRKIEGVHTIYNYLNNLEKTIENGKAPLLIDCLSCENGCNQGPLTLTKNQTLDETEFYIKQRVKKIKEKYLNQNENDQNKSIKKIEETINKYWDKELYTRNYINRWQNNNLKYPIKEQIEEIYNNLLKSSKEDIQNCSSCGYNTCEGMAIAIFNNLNKIDNCHLYRKKISDKSITESNKSKSKIETIIHTAQDGFIEVNLEKIITNANEAAQRIIKKSDIIGRSLNEFLDYENQQILNKELNTRKEGGESIYEINFSQSDGNKIPALVSASPLRDFETNKIIGSFALITDISNLKQTQNELIEAKENLEQKVRERTSKLNETLEEIKQQREELITQKDAIEESEAKIFNILQMLPEAAFIIDAKGYVTFWNKKIEELTGYKSIDMLGKGNYEYSIPFYGNRQPLIIDLINIDDNTLFTKYKDIERIGDILKAETYVPLLKGQERFLIVRASALYDKDNNFIGAIEIIEDATEKQYQKEKIEKQSQELKNQATFMSEMLEESKINNEIIADINNELSKLSIAVSNTENPIVIMDINGNFEWINTAFTKTFGLTMQNLMLEKKNNIKILSNYAQINEIFEEVIKEKESRTFFNTDIDINSHKIYNQITLTPILNEYKEVKNLVAIFSDVSELKLAEEILTQQKEEIIAQRDALHDSTKKINQILESLPDAAFVIDTHGNIEFWNKAIENMTGLKSENMIGKGNYEYALPFHNKRSPMLIDFVNKSDKEIFSYNKNIKKLNNILQSENYAQSLLGKKRYLLGTATAIFDKEGNYSGAIEIIHDLSEMNNYIKEIEEQRQNITQSIKYALRIQEAFMPNLEPLKNVFNDYFVFFKPRDIVSGDFYWILQKENKTYIAVADCTGHGVPGAFMSMLGISFLNQIVTNNYNISANLILEHLKNLIIFSLNQNIEDFNGSRDGMDISVVIYNKDSKILQYSGAFNNIYVVSQEHENFQLSKNLRVFELQNTNKKLYELKADKMPIGVYIKNENFTQKTIKLSTKDRIFMHTDGFQDLYNFNESTKFSSKRYKKLLLETSSESMLEQFNSLKFCYKLWIGDSKQVDDILILGIEV